MTPYSVFVTLTLKPDFMDILCSEIGAAIPKARSEAGCIGYHPTRAADGSPSIHIFELWASKAAFDTHNAQPYIVELFAKLGGWLNGAPQIIEVTALDG